MKKILITGFSGFVSQHFVDYLKKNKIEIEILGVDINEPEDDININFEKLDLLDIDELKKTVTKFKPDYILHLASYSSVRFSWENPSLSFKNNMNIFLNLMEVIREVLPSCRVLSVGSSEQYGNLGDNEFVLEEDCSLLPVSPYAVARVAQENLSRVYCDGYGLDIVMTRSFNHIGPKQKNIFVISSFAKQLVEIKNNGKKGAKLVTGDVTVVRDFLDVRDVVDAYYKLLLEGEKGQVYNICSGVGISLKEIIELMCEILGIDVSLETDSRLLRPNENKKIIGSNRKIVEKIGWEQKIPLRKSLEDIINYWSYQ
jgi:GDP-4-dehydro-6-deoxy-D-mannose reductase